MGRTINCMIKDVIIKKTKNKGKGLFVLKNFKKGELIFSYKKGKIFAEKDLKKLTKWELDHIDELDNNKFELMKKPQCFVNHSCDPNSISKGRSYFSLKPIKKSQEVTVDYRSKGIFKNKWKCECGSKNCKGYVISDFFSLPLKDQKLYLPYTLKVIKKDYKRRYKFNCR